GVLDAGRGGEKALLAAVSNPRGVTGGIAEALSEADVFVGLSGGTLPEELLATMAPESIVFALSNPDPEVHPDVAHRHAAIVATGRSDFPNQINNVLAFPGVFRGALDAGARRITERMKLAAADAILAVGRADLAPDMIVPSPFDPRVAQAVATAVAEASL
ncbi:MAG TPA: malic enzyme-like NAD(P)-binding protein, partial [Pseudonocardia sp.]